MGAAHPLTHPRMHMAPGVESGLKGMEKPAARSTRAEALGTTHCLAMQTRAAREARTRSTAAHNKLCSLQQTGDKHSQAHSLLSRQQPATSSCQPPPHTICPDPLWQPRQVQKGLSSMHE